MDTTAVLPVVRVAKEPKKMKAELLGGSKELALVRVPGNPEDFGPLV
jgi:hypothetical protein